MSLSAPTKQPSPEARADTLLNTFLGPSDGEQQPWTESYAAAVRERRQCALDGCLLVDRLLDAAGVPDTLYPPADPAQAFVLVAAVLASAAGADAQHALIYYLVCERATPDGDAPNAFAASVHLAPRTATETCGYWFVDHGAFPRAIPCLRSAHLLPVVAQTIGCAMDGRRARSGGAHDAAAVSPPHAARLLLQLYEVHGSLPAVAEPPTDSAVEQLSLLATALTYVHGVVAAWDAVRAVLGAVKAPAGSPRTLSQGRLADRLYDTLFCFCFAPPRAEAVRQLLVVPMSTDEERRWEAFALSSASPARQHAAVAMDSLFLKLVQQGRYVDAIRADERAAHVERTLAFASADGASAARGVADAARLRQRRKTLLDGLWAVLPAVERDVLMGAELAGAAEARADAPRADAARAETPAHSADTPPAGTTGIHGRRSAAPAQRPSLPLRSSASLRSSSPFAHTRPAPPRAASLRAPSWGVPVPTAARSAGEAAGERADKPAPAVAHGPIAAHSDVEEMDDMQGEAQDDDRAMQEDPTIEEDAMHEEAAVPDDGHAHMDDTDYSAAHSTRDTRAYRAVHTAEDPHAMDEDRSTASGAGDARADGRRRTHTGRRRPTASTRAAERARSPRLRDVPMDASELVMKPRPSQAPPHVTTPATPSAPGDVPSLEVPQRRPRRAAQKAAEALRSALRPHAEEPKIPGGFPAWEEERAPAEPRETTTPVRTPRRPRRTSRATTPAESAGMRPSHSMYPSLPDAPLSPGLLPRAASTTSVAYPHGTLARLQANTDTQPIARRTRAQAVERASQGSQTSDVSEGDADAQLTRRRARDSAPATPRFTRSSRRLGDGTSPGDTPRTPRRRR
ncbi:hypothetical protein MSPP1_004184 [Malassezia sp. CBS 17886]|nr:hypothetical protein MSPP1_004184 [Malassezia sp. CBS 17886]